MIDAWQTMRSSASRRLGRYQHLLFVGPSAHRAATAPPACTRAGSTNALGDASSKGDRRSTKKVGRGPSKHGGSQRSRLVSSIFLWCKKNIYVPKHWVCELQNAILYLVQLKWNVNVKYAIIRHNQQMVCLSKCKWKLSDGGVDYVLFHHRLHYCWNKTHSCFQYFDM